ncbi:MAG TPA: exodeoxyribonuclease I [Xanthomonadales bacterium]|nr:exodeoxyribonuclease I [Xanthomonadales bacterium]
MEFLWHDYETFGTVPAVDRPCQFAACRTDADLNPVGEPLEMYCAPADDVLPRPGACLVTGITPQLAAQEGRVEAEFARIIHKEMMKPGTCSAGYNSIRFDDEVSRNLFYRNLLDPYEREWKNGNSRWDLINLTRMCYALRPQGIEWPMVETSSGSSGTRPSFRLEDLTQANGIGHQDAHDALADVNATIEMARVIRAAQPRLFEWSLKLRNKFEARKLLDVDAGTPVIHTSGRIPAVRGCTSLVLPLAPHPRNDKAVIVFDLMGDAEALLQCDAESIRDRVFTPSADLPEDVKRLPLKAIKWNAVPMVAPAAVLKGVDQDRIGLDSAKCLKNAALLNANIVELQQSVMNAFHTEFEAREIDPDLAIYSGGFFDDYDRQQMLHIHQCTPGELAAKNWEFHDKRLTKMLLRFRARNWPDTLSQDDWDAWESDRHQRLKQPADGEFYGIDAFNQDLAAAREQKKTDPEAMRILDELEGWAINLKLKD